MTAVKEGVVLAGKNGFCGAINRQLRNVNSVRLPWTGDMIWDN